jgi:DNA-binding response OmpR family regulator
MNSKDAWAWVGESDFAAESLPDKLRREQRTRRKSEKHIKALPFQIVLGGQPIQLEPIEYRLVLFLAARPYYAFTKREIFDGIKDFFDVEPVSEETISAHIQSLRDKLGFFRDFVQTVPHIGYRFKP